MLPSGDPLALLLVMDGQLQEHCLLPGSAQTVVVPAGVWQAARASGRWSLMVCAVALVLTLTTFKCSANFQKLNIHQLPWSSIARARCHLWLEFKVAGSDVLL